MILIGQNSDLTLSRLNNYLSCHVGVLWKRVSLGLSPTTRKNIIQFIRLLSVCPVIIIIIIVLAVIRHPSQVDNPSRSQLSQPPTPFCASPIHRCAVVVTHSCQQLVVRIILLPFFPRRRTSCTGDIMNCTPARCDSDLLI